MKFLYLLLKILSLAILMYVNAYHFDWLTSFEIKPLYVQLVVNFFIFLITANLIVSLLSWFYRQRKGSKKGYDNVTIGLTNIYYLLLTGAIIFTILGFFGVDPHTLFTSLSIVAAAIAIISKEFLAEVISGIILSFSKEISVDDYLKIGEHRGKIVDLKFTKVVFLNDDDDIVYLPNFKVFNSDIINYTRNEIRRVNIDFEVMLEAIKSVEELEKDLIQAINDYQEHIEPNSYNLKIETIYKDYLVLKFQYTLVQSNDRELEKEIRRTTVRRVVNYVKTNYHSPKR